jgi:hypothetical protein
MLRRGVGHIELVADPAADFIVIMKDVKIFKSLLKH